jgi:hypothetical protein
VTGQAASESFSGRLISVDQTRVPMHFAIPSVEETESVRDEIRSDRSGEA